MMSMFCPLKTSPDAHLGIIVPPFAGSFGANVLRCGLPGCRFEFFHKHDIDNGIEATGQKNRTRRVEHFSSICGVDTSFASQTGLPEPTSAPRAPKSYHNTLHISTARAWSSLSYNQKKAISKGATGQDDSAIANFVQVVRLQICGASHRGSIY